MSEEEPSTPTRGRRTKRSNGEESPLSPSSFAKETVTKRPRLRSRKRTSTGLQRVFVDVLGWGIFSLWAIGFSVDMLDLKKGWDLPAGIWGLMTIVSGAAFVAQAMKKESGE